MTNDRVQRGCHSSSNTGAAATSASRHGSRPRLLALSCAAAVSVWASSAVTAQQATESIEEIIVTSVNRRPESLGDINASVGVLSQEELELVSHQHIQEVANRLAGVNISRNNGQESLTSIRSPVLTGAGACGAFLLAEQGIPLRAAGFCNVNELFDANSENASRIEVIRGPATAYYGSNAVHGLINVVLPDPSEGGSVSLEAGPRGSSRVNATLGMDYGNFKHMFLFNGASENGYRDDSGFDQQKLSWRYQMTTEGGYDLDGGFTFTNLNQETAGYVLGTDAYKDSDLRDTNPNPEAYRDNQSLRAWTRITKELDSGWEVVLTPYVRDSELNFIQHFLPGAPTEENEHSSVGIQSAVYKDLDENSTISYGLDLEATSGTLKQTQASPTNTGSAFLNNTIPVGKHYDYEVDATQVSPFVQYQRYFDNGFDITLGLRYERMEYDYDNRMINGRTRDDGVACGFGGCRYSRPADRSDTFGDFAPKLAIRYQLNDFHNVQLRLNKGYRAPQATELYRLQNAQTVADLDSVEIDSAELGLEGSGNTWQYAVTAYYMDKENEIINDSSRANLNGSHTKHRGIEFSGGLDISESVSLRGAYNIARHTYENDLFSGGVNINGNDVDTAPRSFGNLQLKWQITDALFTELEWVNMGDYYTNPENLNEYDGHDILNLRTRWQANADLSFALNILNLSDKEYAERADFSFGNDRYFPGEPLRAFFSVHYKF
ncbi:MAG: TonB-dependent receptor [Pseudohongiellaceae bacterium]|nr:TonB-dependent receptor [Pseudohongiellaceae bacterium]